MCAHRRHEYLQATRVAIEPDGVEFSLDLTPGIDVAERVLAEIDRDGSRSIDAAEGRRASTVFATGTAIVPTSAPTWPTRSFQRASGSESSRNAVTSISASW